MIEGLVFREFLLRDADVLSDEQLDLCQEDLVALAIERNSDERATYREWLRRLGGTQNILPYARTLEAGARR